MSTTIDNLITGLANLKQNGNNGSENSKPEKTEFWVNVGIERAGKLVSLPMGIPMDKLEARKIPGSSSKNTEFRFLRLAEADLWSKMQQIMAQLKPGEVVKLPFTVELRRCEATEQPTAEDTAANPFSIGDITLK